MAGPALRRVLKRVALAVVAFGSAAIVAEIGLRTVFVPEDFGTDAKLGKRFHPYWKLRFVSGQQEFDTRFTYNSAGMRDRETPRSKPCGVTRIIAIGDGFTEGREVGGREHWPAVLDSLLAEQLDVEVVNAGRSGSGTAAHYLVLKHFALPRAPDLVILALFLNDIAESVLAEDQFEWDAEGLPVRMRGRRLLLSNVVRNQLARLPFMWTVKTTGRAGGGPSPSDTLAILRKPAAPRIEPMWQRSRQLVAATARLSESAGADFLLLVVPLGDQIGSGDLSPYARASQLSRAELGREPQHRILQMARELDIDALDPLPALSRIGGELHFPHDGHWNPAGHRAMAGILRDHLVSSGWIGRRRAAGPGCADASSQ